MNATLISALSAAVPQASGDKAGKSSAGLNPQAAGFGDMLEVLLMALAPAALVESMTSAPVAPKDATGAAPLDAMSDMGVVGTRQEGKSDLSSVPSQAKAASWATDVAVDALARLRWFAITQVVADDGAAIAGAGSPKATAAKATAAPAPASGNEKASMDLAIVKLLTEARPQKSASPLPDVAVAPDNPRPASQPITDLVITGQTTPKVAVALAEGDVKPRLATGSLPSSDFSVPSSIKVSGSSTAVAHAGTELGKPQAVRDVLPTGNEPAKLTFKLAPTASLDAGPNATPDVSGPVKAASTRAGDAGQANGASPAGDPVNARTLPPAAGQGMGGADVSTDSNSQKYSRAQSEAPHRAAEVASKFDLSSIGLARPDASAANQVRAGVVRAGQDTAGTSAPTQAVFDAIADRAQVARLRGENLARLELATNDGNTIRIRISVHDNAVSARISVTSTAIRDALAQHMPELSERLQTNGLVAETIQVSLLGERDSGSEGHQERQESGRSRSSGEPDLTNPTLIETEDVGFEKWA
ncbi:MAG TPA: flagellar hook-length control protein FliK [bacterium]|nr:flagellar hook-length control protein FliK [bacterium]